MDLEPRKITAMTYVSHEMTAPEEYWTDMECDKHPGQGEHSRSRHRGGFVAPCFECERESREALARNITRWLEDNAKNQDGCAVAVRHVFGLHVTKDASDMCAECEECSAYDREGLSGCGWPCPTLVGVVEAVGLA